MIGDKQPDKFRRGQPLTAAALNAIVDSVLTMLRRLFGARLEQPLNLQAILDEDLDAAAAWDTTPATATASVWHKDSGGDMVDTGDNVEVVNRCERISYEAGAYVKLEWIDAEWQVYAADCPE